MVVFSSKLLAPSGPDLATRGPFSNGEGLGRGV